MHQPKAILSWSSGKDSAMALYRTLASKQFEVVCLLTTLSQPFRRVSMHGVREELLDRQAGSLGIHLEKVLIPYPCPNAVYEEKMRNTLSLWKERGVTHVIFGDLFLEDIRRYREANLSQLDLTPVFPIWGTDTTSLAREMLEVGFRAVLTCVDPKKLDGKFAGRQFDSSLLEDLPPMVDPCGENGEFHTFVYDGPIFRESIPVEIGQSVLRDGFQFADVLLKR
ncbi:MAG: ATP-binding protein [Candidatus Bathyarchaeia archaeon]